MCKRCGKEEYYDSAARICKGCDIIGGKFLNKTTNVCEDCPLGLRYVVEAGMCM